MVKNFEYIFIHFNRIHEHAGHPDGQMDGQTLHDGRGHAYA